MPSNQFRRLALAQLDQRVRGITPVATPRGGWISTVRKTLGISQTQLGRRLGIGQQAVASLEASEARKVISIAHLESAARVLGGRLVYAIVPAEDPSFEALLRKRARLVAEQLVARAERTMALENQNGTDKDREDDIADLAEELFRGFDRRLWEGELSG